MGSHSLLQGIFPTQEWNPGLLHCRQILYCLSLQESPSIIITQDLLGTWQLLFFCLPGMLPTHIILLQVLHSASTWQPTPQHPRISTHPRSGQWECPRMIGLGWVRDLSSANRSLPQDCSYWSWGRGSKEAPTVVSLSSARRLWIQGPGHYILSPGREEMSWKDVSSGSLESWVILCFLQLSLSSVFSPQAPPASFQHISFHFNRVGLCCSQLNLLNSTVCQALGCWLRMQPRFGHYTCPQEAYSLQRETRRENNLQRSTNIMGLELTRIQGLDTSFMTLVRSLSSYDDFMFKAM